MLSATPLVTTKIFNHMFLMDIYTNSLENNIVLHLFYNIRRLIFLYKCLAIQ